MKWKRIAGFAICAAIVCTVTGIAQPGSHPNETGDSGLPSGIVWYGKLEDGLNAAKISGKPILLLSAAPQCAGVPGMW